MGAHCNHTQLDVILNGVAADVRDRASVNGCDGVEGNAVYGPGNI
jgi:hypothetical protein